MKKSEFGEYLGGVREAVKTTGSNGNSGAVATEITTKLLNTPEFEMPSYKENAKGGFDTIPSLPVKEFRAQVANASAKALGMDRADADALSDKLEFTQAFGASFNAAADAAEACYLSTGRTKNKPQLSGDVSRVSMRIGTVAAKTEDTKKIVQDPKTKKYESVPTGKRVTTKEHQVMKLKNSTMPWMKTSKDVK